MLLHQKDDYNKKGKKLEERDKTTLLPNATHYIIVDTTEIMQVTSTNRVPKIDGVKGEKIINRISSKI